MNYNFNDCSGAIVYLFVEAKAATKRPCNLMTDRCGCGRLRSSHFSVLLSLKKIYSVVDYLLCRRGASAPARLQQKGKSDGMLA